MTREILSGFAYEASRCTGRAKVGSALQALVYARAERQRPSLATRTRARARRSRLRVISHQDVEVVRLILRNRTQHAHGVRKPTPCRTPRAGAHARDLGGDGTAVDVSMIPAAEPHFLVLGTPTIAFNSNTQNPALAKKPWRSHAPQLRDKDEAGRERTARARTIDQWQR